MINNGWQILNISLAVAVLGATIGMGVYGWGRRRFQRTGWFVALCVCVSIVSLFYLFEAFVTPSIEIYISFAKFEYIGLVFLPVTWLGLALSFGRNHEFLTRPRLGLLCVIPTLTVLAAFTNEYHGLIWATPRFEATGDWYVWSPDYGFWFWVSVIYSYVIYFIGSIILLRRAMDAWELYRTQALMLLVGTSMPWLSNILEIIDAPFLNEVYLNVPAFGLATGFLALAMFRYNLLDIAPLAYDTIVNNVPDGLLVTDRTGRIVALNKPIIPYLNLSDRTAIGKQLVDVFPQYREQIEAMRKSEKGEITLHIADRAIEVRHTPVTDRRGGSRGMLYVMRDITAEIQNEVTERDARNFAEAMISIGRGLNGVLEPDEVLTRMTDSIQNLLPNARIMLIVLDDDGHTLRVRKHAGYTDFEAPILDRLTFDLNTFHSFQTAALMNEPLVIPDTSVFPNWTNVEGLEWVRSAAIAAVRPDNKLIGFLEVDGASTGEINAEIAQKLDIFAQQVGIAFKNARLYEQTRLQGQELQRRIEMLTITQRVTNEIGFSFNVEAVLEIALDAGMRLSGAESGYIALVNEDDVLEIVQYYGLYDIDKQKALLKQKAGIIGGALTHRGSVMALTADEISTVLPDVVAQIALPLRVGGTSRRESAYGILVLEATTLTFTLDRVQLLELLADRVAVALENGRLLRTSQERAAELEMLYERVSKLESLKSEMIGVAAHDLKNPLSVILNYLALLNEDAAWRENPDELYDAMMRSANRMHQIIKDFLSLERIEKIADEQTMEPFDLRTIVTRAGEEYRPRANDKSIALNVYTPDETCTVYGDQVQLYEAITNFVGNAIKYTPEGGRVDCTITLDDHTVELTVRDTGFGIPEDRQRRLFEPFYRVKSDEVEKIEGTGLGLHIARNIIERHRGTIIFESVYHKGSTFGFRMPLHMDASAQLNETQQKGNQRETVSADYSPES